MLFRVKLKWKKTKKHSIPHCRFIPKSEFHDPCCSPLSYLNLTVFWFAWPLFDCLIRGSARRINRRINLQTKRQRVDSQGFSWHHTRCFYSVLFRKPQKKKSKKKSTSQLRDSVTFRRKMIQQQSEHNLQLRVSEKRNVKRADSEMHWIIKCKNKDFMFSS